MEGFWSTMRDDLVQSFGSSLTKVTPKTEIFPGDLLYHHGFGRIILVIGKSSENFVRERYDHTLVFKGVTLSVAPAENYFEVREDWCYLWCPKNKLLRPFPREK
jgi:hypothetical protein